MSGERHLFSRLFHFFLILAHGEGVAGILPLLTQGSLLFSTALEALSNKPCSRNGLKPSVFTQSRIFCPKVRLEGPAGVQRQLAPWGCAGAAGFVAAGGTWPHVFTNFWKIG